MEGRLLLKNCSVLGPDSRLRSGVSVLVEGDRITQVKEAEALPGLPGDWEVPCVGRWVVTSVASMSRKPRTAFVGGSCGSRRRSGTP